MRLSKRETAQLYVSKSGDIALDAASDDEAAFSYPPRLRLRIAGRGAPLFSLARQTMSAGFDVIVQSPDISDFPVAEFMHLRNPAHPPAIRDDARTAFVMLFHNHEWEDALLEQALAGPAFYIGAMGSAQTHAARLDKLRSAGISDADCARIKGPIGLIAALRDADLLALSVLAEITQIAGVNELL